MHHPHPFGGWRPLSARLILAAAAWLLAAPAHALTDQQVYDNTCGSGGGCHSSPPDNGRRNAANSVSFLNWALANVGSMAGVAPSASDKSQIVAHIESVYGGGSISRSVNFQTQTDLDMSPYVMFAQTSGLDRFNIGNSTPSKMTVSQPAIGTASIRVTPLSCQVGAASFTYSATNGSSNPTTSTRTVSITINNPSTGPTWTGATSASAQTGAAFSFNLTVSACPSLVTYSHVGGTMPTGLSVSGSQITGTVGTSVTPGAYPVTIRATYTGGAFTDRVITINVAQGPPVLTGSPSPHNGTELTPISTYQIVATNGSSFTYGATGLPPGLNVNTTNGQITGTPTTSAFTTAFHDYTVTLSADNGTLSSTYDVIFHIGAKPIISSAASAPASTGQPFSYQIVASKTPTLYAAAGLPANGLALNTSTGVISGTPVSQGTMNLTLTATNGAGTSTSFPFTINVGLGPPIINSPLAASAGEGQSFNYQITATQSPTSFGATGLPAGLAIDATTGIISGTPGAGTAAGSPYNVNISATNAGGTGNATLVISLSQFAPVVNSSLTASGQTGIPFTYQITASNAPTSFNATGLPAGLSINTTTGLISGTPAVGTQTGSPYNVAITAQNGTPPPSTKTLVLTITLGPPVITSPATATGAVGFATSYQITASNSPSSYNATGLPPGLAINTATGLISGTPTTNGTFVAAVSATNSTSTASQPVTFTIAVGLPAVTSLATVAVATNAAFSYQIAATNGPTSFGATGLPPELSVDPTTGLVTGSFGTAGTRTFTVSATNGTGTGTRLVTVNVSQSAPVVTSGNYAAGAVGAPFTYTLTYLNLQPGTITLTGLPAGLTFDTRANLITGTPTLGGTYSVLVDLTNSGGTVQFKITIEIAFAVPTAADLEVQVPFEQSATITLPITGQFNAVTLTSQPEHGLVTIQGGVATYSPAQGYSGPDKFTFTATNPAGTTRVATVNITVGTIVPTASAMAMSVQVNTAGTVDLAGAIKASGLTGVSISTLPAHGTVTVDGTKVTYTPRTDFFGRDSFSYIAYGNGGKSSPAPVTVTVTGRPDPTRDANVAGLVDAQAQAARRFTHAQVSNYQRRLEQLHRPEPPEGAQRVAEADKPAEAATAAASATPQRSAAAEARREAAARSGFVPVSLMSPLVGLASTGSVTMNADTGGAFRGVQAWIGGSGQFGKRDAEGDRSGLRFSTDGISVGVDKRFSERLVLGLGVGYGRDESDVGQDGSRSKARAQSFALYGSYQPTRATFIDLVLGSGRLEFDTRRHVAAVDAMATGSRDGTQLYGSVAAGAELRRDGVLFAPYVRYDAARDKLDAFSESGVGDYALAFRSQTLRSSQLGAGLRVEAQHDTDFGAVMPRARVEYRRELADASAARLSYADLLGSGTEYAVTPAGVSRNALLLGFGADLQFRGGLRIGFDWQASRQGGTSNGQAVRLLVSQELDARGSSRWSWQPRMFKDPIGVEAGYAYDDNVSRGRRGEELGDSLYSLSVGEPIPFKLESLPNLRLMVTPSLTGEKFRRYQGLGRVAAGVDAQLQYRSSGAFDATTWALVGRAGYDQYESDYRRGARYFAGVSARRSLTDRIDLFAEAGRNMREGKSEVFQTRDWAGKLNLDYSLGRRGVLYLAGEYRHGDLVSTGPASLANLAIAEVFVPDDAFDGLDLFAYRTRGRTVIGTVGWNYPLGPRDSFDLSWRRVQAQPSKRWGLDGGTIRYNDNQYSLVYLMRF